MIVRVDLYSLILCFWERNFERGLGGPGGINMVTVLILSQPEMSSLVSAVAEAGHQVIEADDGGDLLQLVAHRPVGVVMLPFDADPIDGEDLLHVVRKRSPASIIVVGPESETESVSSLLNGADAYLPFMVSANIVRVRIGSLLRLPQRTYSASIMDQHPNRLFGSLQSPATGDAVLSDTSTSVARP